MTASKGDELDPAIQTLSDSLIDEIINAVGLPKTAGTRKAFNLLFHKAAGRLAEIGVRFDRLIDGEGFPAACKWVLTQLVPRHQEPRCGQRAVERTIIGHLQPCRCL